MNPTCQLRFVERMIYTPVPAHNAYGQEGTISEGKRVKILQQWFADSPEKSLYPHGEWRDVQLEKET